jgi:hypothetical protein
MHLSQLKLMLIIERNTRGLRDSLAVRLFRKTDRQHSLTFALAATTGQVASLFQGSLQC